MLLRKFFIEYADLSSTTVQIWLLLFYMSFGHTRLQETVTNGSYDEMLYL